MSWSTTTVIESTITAAGETTCTGYDSLKTEHCEQHCAITSGRDVLVAPYMAVVAAVAQRLCLRLVTFSNILGLHLIFIAQL